MMRPLTLFRQAQTRPQTEETAPAGRLRPPVWRHVRDHFTRMPRTMIVGRLAFIGSAMVYGAWSGWHRGQSVMSEVLGGILGGTIGSLACLWGPIEGYLIESRERKLEDRETKLEAKELADKQELLDRLQNLEGKVAVLEAEFNKSRKDS